MEPKDSVQIVTSPAEMRAMAEAWRKQELSIALVPTMGYLHDGHLSLVRHARQRAKIVVVSIFVNPMQFGANEDFDKYPRDLERDCKMVAEEGADVVFAPAATEMYGESFQTTVQVRELTRGLCGASRPGHFDGVTTVVCKLFNIVKPHLAVFGAKDYQQAMVVRRMIIDLNLNIDLDLAPIVREESGLAMSSRNEYLSAEERAEAAILFQSLRMAERLILQGERDPEKVQSAMSAMIDAVASSKIDYIALVDPESLMPVSVIDRNIRILLAVYIGRTRLIDNYLVELSAGIE